MKGGVWDCGGVWNPGSKTPSSNVQTIMYIDGWNQAENLGGVGLLGTQPRIRVLGVGNFLFLRATYYAQSERFSRGEKLKARKYRGRNFSPS